MRTENFEGTIAEYQGKAVSPVITYSGTVELFTNVEEARASEDWPNESGILKMVNQKLLAAAKASKYQEASKELKAAYEASPDFKRANLVKALVATGKSEKEALALAESFMA